MKVPKKKKKENPRHPSREKRVGKDSRESIGNAHVRYLMIVVKFNEVIEY